MLQQEFKDGAIYLNKTQIIDEDRKHLNNDGDYQVTQPLVFYRKGKLITYILEKTSNRHNHRNQIRIFPHPSIKDMEFDRVYFIDKTIHISTGWLSCPEWLGFK